MDCVERYNCFQEHLVSKIYEKTYETPFKNKPDVLILKKMFNGELGKHPLTGYKRLKYDLKNSVYLKSYKHVFETGERRAVLARRAPLGQPCVYVKNVIEYLLDDTIKFVKAWILGKPELIEYFIRADYDYKKMQYKYKGVNPPEPRFRWPWQRQLTVISRAHPVYGGRDCWKVREFPATSAHDEESIRAISILLIKMYIVSQRTKYNDYNTILSVGLNSDLISSNERVSRRTAERRRRGIKPRGVMYYFRYRTCLMQMFKYFPNAATDAGVLDRTQLFFPSDMGVYSYEQLFHTYLFCLDTKHISSSYIHMYDTSARCLQRLKFEFGNSRCGMLETINELLKKLHNTKYANTYTLLSCLPEDIVKNIGEYFVCPKLDYGELSYYMHQIYIS